MSTPFPLLMEKSMSLLPHRNEIFVSYTITHLFRGPLALLYQDAFDRSTIDPSCQSLMVQCLLTMSTVFFGIHNRENRILRIGTSMYCQNLSMLNHVLGEEGCEITSETIVAVLALSIVEV